MAGKSKGKKKDKKEAADDGGSQKEEKKTKKKGKNKGKSNMDILTPAAMDNVYYGCHNVQELLLARGFHPADFAKKKKKR